MKLYVKGSVERILITEKNESRSNKIYDKIYDVFDKYSTLFTVNSEDEYETDDGYVIEVKSPPPDAMAEISEIRGVEIL